MSALSPATARKPRRPAFRWLRSREALVCLLGLLVWAAAVQVDAFEYLINLSRTHESWELDEKILAVAVAGLVGLTLLAGRGRDLRREIRLRDEAEQEVAWLALHDPLTRLPNRRFLESHVARGGDGPDQTPLGLAALCLDLDGFKQVNSLVGHAGGDQLLAEVARRLTVAAPGCVVARLGGDEFVIVADRRDTPDPIALGHAVVEALRPDVSLGGISLRVGASVGVAETPRDCARLSEALELADAALYEAKRTGRDQVVDYDSSMSESVRRRADLEMRLRRAMAERRIRPRYQALASLEDGGLIGFEALARWEEERANPPPGGGDLPPQPAVFIPLAEEMGLMTELSDSLLAQACRDARAWPAHLRLSFNISPVQLSDMQLASRILWILDAHEFPASRLQIEVSESAMTSRPAQGGRLVAELRAAGVRVALDDFGAGYSSLAQIAELRFDVIKIDRSFISGPDEDETRREIVKAIVALGRGLGLVTTAEGVENAEQLERLRDLGCDTAQGFVFGQVLSAEAAAELAAGAAHPFASHAPRLSVPGAVAVAGTPQARAVGPSAPPAGSAAAAPSISPSQAPLSASAPDRARSLGPCDSPD